MHTRTLRRLPGLPQTGLDRLMARQTPRSSLEITESIRRVKAFARNDLEAIHLVESDFEKVKRKPARYDVTKQPDGKLVTVFRGRLIEVRSAENPFVPDTDE